MARSIFACAECGGAVTVIGRNRADASRLVKWHEAQKHICEACEAKKRNAENQKAAASNAAAGLPALAGTEKQVAWAETIRAARLERVRAWLTPMRTLRSLEGAQMLTEEAMREFEAQVGAVDPRNPHGARSQFRELYQEIGSVERYTVLIVLLERQARASWWIEHRDVPLPMLARELAHDIDEAIEAARPLPPEEASAMQAAQEEALLKPATPKSSQIAEVRVVDGELRVLFPEKREEFRLLMREAGFRWAERHWMRRLGFTTGDPSDRVAETAHRILAAGFMVLVHDEDARARAVSGSFTPEQTRWVFKAGSGTPYPGWCAISWARAEDFYQPARRLLGSRYKDGRVYVPPGSVVEVMDFAEAHGFAVSAGVRAMHERHLAAIASGAVITDPKVPPVAVRVEESDVPPPLAPVQAEIDPELLDG